jgi:hypothetical protein
VLCETEAASAMSRMVGTALRCSPRAVGALGVSDAGRRRRGAGDMREPYP